MKRPILAILTAALLVGCGAPEPATITSDALASGWVTPPMIETVERGANGLRVRGGAAPGGRVVLRDEGGVASAISADDAGQFEIRIAAPAQDTLFIVETQVGEDTAPAPYRLLVARDPAGPVALIGPGGATRRLDPAGGLDVIDSDGRALVASGRAAAGTQVAIGVGGQSSTVVAGPDGRWSLTLPPGTASSVGVDQQTFVWPTEVPDAEGRLTPAPGGWWFTWQVSPTSSQASWFPAAGP